MEGLSQENVPQGIIPECSADNAWKGFQLQRKRDSSTLSEAVKKIEEKAKEHAAQGFAAFVAPSLLENLFREGDFFAAQNIFDKPSITKMGPNTGSVTLARRDPESGFAFFESEWLFQGGPPARTKRIFCVIGPDGLIATFGHYFIERVSETPDEIVFYLPSKNLQVLSRVDDCVSELLRELPTWKRVGPDDILWKSGYLRRMFF